MKRVLLATLFLFSACKEQPRYEVLPEPIIQKTNPPGLPDGEQYVTTPAPQTEAEAMAEPLVPPESDYPNASEKFRRAYEQEVRFSRGEAADLDGDGRKESVGKWVRGVFTYAKDMNGDGVPDITDDGTTHTVDWNYDGRPDAVTVISIRPNGGEKTVETSVDDDGVMSKRETTEILGPPDKMRWTNEELQNGRWVVTSTHIESGIQHAIEEQEGESKPDGLFPSNVGPPWVDAEGPVKILMGDPDTGRCGFENAAALEDALICAKERVATKLLNLNPKLSEKMVKFLASPPRRPALTVVACNGTDGRYGGGTTRNVPVIWAGKVTQAHHISMPYEIALKTEKQTCELLMHELMHAAGVDSGDQHNSKRDDIIYSCSRQAAGCSDATHGYRGPDTHRDCATCASGKLKTKCGGRSMFGEGPAPANPNLACVRVTDKVELIPCATTRRVDGTYCDDTPVAPGGCCTSCQPGSYAAGGGFCPATLPNTCVGELIWCEI